MQQETESAQLRKRQKNPKKLDSLSLSIVSEKSFSESSHSSLVRNLPKVVINYNEDQEMPQNSLLIDIPEEAFQTSQINDYKTGESHD